MNRFLIVLAFMFYVAVANAAVTVSVNGSNHTIPQTNEKGWGTNVTAWIQAISQYTLQPNGGSFTLTGEVNTGATYGFKVPYIKTATASPSTVGVLRLANSDSVGFRNAANDGNLLLAVDSANALTFNGAAISTTSSGSFQDSTFNIYDDGDPTKLIAFQASGISTATTRTITVPDAAVDLGILTAATSSNTNSAIVRRDGSGNFSATTVTANLTGAVTGNASTATALASDPSDCGANNYATSIAASGDLTCGTVTSAGLSGSIDATKIADGSVTSTEFQYINTLTSNAQTQFDAITASKARVAAYDSGETINDSTYANVVFSTERHDTASAFNGTTFTVPTTGYYHIAFCGSAASDAANGTLSVTVAVGGTPITGAGQFGTFAQVNNYSMACVVSTFSLTATNAVTFQARENSSGTVTGEFTLSIDEVR